MVDMSDQRLASYVRLRALVVAQASANGGTGLAGGLRSVCVVACIELDAAGSAVHLMTSDGPEGVAAASDGRAAELGELAFTVGEGPGIDAWRTTRPVLAPDLAALADRWPVYAGTVLDSGIGGVLAFPLAVGAVGFGVLEVFVATTRPLDGDDVATAMNLARVATEILYDGRGTDGIGSLDLVTALDHRVEIHQAQGMVMVALGVSLVDALLRMRAHAFAANLPLLQLARGVVSGDDDPRKWDP